MATEAPGDRDRERLFAPLPVEGAWSAVGLTRGQFAAILVASTLLFLLWGRPLWQDPRGAHFGRLATSYSLIPALCAAALARNGKLGIPNFLGATGMIAFLKLIVTAGLDLVIGTVFTGR